MYWTVQYQSRDFQHLFFASGGGRVYSIPMNVIGIVAISVLCALFGFAVLAAAGVLIWLAIRLRRELAEAKKQNESVYAETGKLLGANQAEIKGLIEGARSKFDGIRAQIQTVIEDSRKATEAAQTAQGKALNEVLATHRKEMQDGIDKINAEALQTVAVRLTQVCVRAEKAIGVLQQMILESEKAPGAEYGAEEFAPEENQFGPPPSGFSRSVTARMDDEADRVATEEVLTEAPAQV
jgi:hypothetical protein